MTDLHEAFERAKKDEAEKALPRIPVKRCVACHFEHDAFGKCRCTPKQYDVGAGPYDMGFGL